MKEGTPPPVDRIPRAEPFDPGTLGFDGLQQLCKQLETLKIITFRRTDFGFENVVGDRIILRDTGEGRDEIFIGYSIQKKMPSLFPTIRDALKNQGLPNEEARIERAKEVLIENGCKVF